MSFAIYAMPRQLVSIPLAAAATEDPRNLVRTAGEWARLPPEVATQSCSLKLQSIAQLLHQAVDASTLRIGNAGVVIRCNASEVIVHYTQPLLALLTRVIHDQSLALDLRHLYVDAKSLSQSSIHTLHLRLEFIGALRTDFKDVDCDVPGIANELAANIGATLHTLRSTNRRVATINVPMEPVNGVDLPHGLLQHGANEDLDTQQAQAD